ncbi:DUF4838 domain-containing protein [Paenibacillus eucommiae]|uniref:SLH domain-containing protein n=1 Tax=Paenibacillus eucommiae TaxID=1355755 RepID=A0ABS4J209_9BACL|nr:DUF4838 domain-containing protein [Paenibacillus eucommiae]MBP1993877.1 hypothetical protein [Paenibacillus eucommiae]
MRFKKSHRKCMMLFMTLCLLFSGFSTSYGTAATPGPHAASISSTPSSGTKEPSDISGHWAEKQLLDWFSRGLVQGNPDGTFKPDSPITRGELMALINRSFGFIDQTPVSFTDLKASDWVYAEVARAIHAGYVDGYADGTIGTKRQVSRQEAAVMIARLLKLDDKSGIDTANAFGDAKQIAQWAKAAVGAISAKKIMNGYEDSSFRPKAPMTRAEAVITLDRTHSLLGVSGSEGSGTGSGTGTETGTGTGTGTGETPKGTSPTPGPTSTSSPTSEPSPSPSSSPSPTPSQSPSPSPTVDPSPTPGPSSEPSPTPSPTPNPGIALGTITGEVADTANVKLEGATVTVTGTTYSAVTDNAGMFEISQVPVGNYTVTVTKANYIDNISNAFDVTDGETAVISIILEPVPGLSIVENGQEKAVIVVEPNVDPKVSAAANTLAEYIKKSTGADLPVLTTAQLAASGTSYSDDAHLYVGVKAPGAESLITGELQDLAEDGFVILPYENTLSIIGPTSWGTEFGVYEFLERYVGVRWLMPGPDGEDVPQLQQIIVSANTVRDEPAAISRHFFGTEAWFTLQTTADWAERNRMHDLVKFHHYLNILFDPQVFANHPEYYPGGVVPTHPYSWQPCFNDETADAAIWRIVDYFNNFPDALSFSLGINDSNNYCAADMARANGKLNSIGVLDMSDVYYSWVNKVVEGVLAEHPNKYFGLLAYWNVYDPPATVELNPHVIPYITDDRMSWIDQEVGEVGEGVTRSWETKAENVGWYEYLYGSPYNLPRMYLDKMAENYRFAKNHGVIAHVAEIYPNFGEGPKPWLSAKLQWNPDLDVDLLANEWYERAVGNIGAPYLKQYYDYWENFWTDRVFDTSWYLDWKNSDNRTNYLNLLDHSYLTAVTKADLTESRRLLELAVAHAGTGKQKKRAELLLRAFEFYEASALSYPRGAVDAPTNEQAAWDMLNDLKQSFEMGKKRKALIDQFTGDPVLNMTLTIYGGKWDGVQEGLITALESYVASVTDPNNAVPEHFRQALANIRSINQFSATAVRTTASKADILQSLDFSQGPWQAAVPITEFISMKSADASPAETRLYLLWDDENIYAGYESFDSNMSGMIVNDDAPNGWWRVADDSVETYLTSDVEGSYTGFFTNPKAVKFIYNKGPNGPEPGIDNQWEASGQIGTDRWNVIQVIPFSSIGIDPAETKTLMGYFLRNYHGQAMFLGWGGGAPWKDEDFRPVHLVEGNNLLQNPSFETGVANQPWFFTDWNVWFLDDGSTTLRSNAFVRTGGYSMEASLVTNGGGPNQGVPIVPGKYKAVLHYYLPLDADTPGRIQWWTQVKNGEGTLEESTSAERPVSWTKGRWVQFEHIFEVKPDYDGKLPDHLQIGIYHWGFNAGEKVYIDDVSLYKLPE